MIVASGPYTSDTDLTFEPFKAVLNAVRQAKPQALVLVSISLRMHCYLADKQQLGPFLDSQHPLIKEGDIDQSTDDIFLQRIAVPLRELVKNDLNSLSVALIPSVRDIVTHRNVFPQGAGIGPPRYQNWVVSHRSAVVERTTPF